MHLYSYAAATLCLTMAFTASADDTTPHLNLHFQVNKTVFDAETPLAQRHAILEKANAKYHLQDLDDRLNSGIIDITKADAFIDAVLHLPMDQQEALMGKHIYLNSPDLLISTSDPTTPENFRHLTHVEIADTQGNTLLVRAPAEIDCTLARATVKKAHTAIDAVNEEIKTLDIKLEAAKGKDPEESLALHSRSDVLSRRATIADTWYRNAEASVKFCTGANRISDAQYKAAKAAASEYSLPGPVGMGD